MMVNHAYGTMTEKTAEVTFQGHKCIVVHHYELNGDDSPASNWYCGYLQVPDFLTVLTEEKLDEIFPSAIGGITYESLSLPDCLPDDGNAYVGFDTMHWGMRGFKTRECLDALKEMAKEVDKWTSQSMEKKGDGDLKLGLRIGERGTVNDFAAIYDLDYLNAMGLCLYRYDDPNFMKVNTKKGNISLNMSKQYVLTYCGNKVWDARKEVYPKK